jgi:hypothetical protein
MKKIFLAFILLTLISFNTCDENPVNGDNVKPGRRDYTWTIDTLFMPFNFFTDITGSSPSDLWACGPGGDLDKTFYHYNGRSWKTDLITRPFSPLSVSSMSANSVWSSGLEGKIWVYNGSQWSEKYQLSSNVDTLIDLITISPLSNQEVMTAGQYFIDNQDFYGLILRYDGTNWIKLNITRIRTAFANIKVSDNSKIYLWGVTNEQSGENRYQFYELGGDNFKEIYSGSQNTNAEYGSLLQIGNKTYFIIGYDFFSYNRTDFSKIGTLSDDPKFLNVGWGRSEKDVFIGMRDGVAHYNGENTVYLYQSTENIFVRKGIIFDKEVFFIGRANGNNLMIHGILNE